MFPLPLTVRLPLAVSLLFLVISGALISLALHGVSRQFDRQIADMGQVYLDGLSAAVLPAVRAGDREQMADVLNRALDTHIGVVDRTLAVAAADGTLLAHVSRYPNVEPLPLDLASRSSGNLFSSRSAGVWTWRALDADHPELGIAVANLDVSEFLRQRRELAYELVLVGLAIGLIGAVLCFGMARRLQRPIILLTERLRQARREPPRELGETAFAHDAELQELLDAYNWMAQGAREREDLAERHARIEREAVLGRMSAALAHEIRNPLGGMRTALQTLRQFGERPEVRQESLAFIERGVQALQAVVDASLRTFRPGDALLQRADIEDIRLMVQAQASRVGVSVQIHCHGIDTAPLALPAAPLRQILLNLVLNAIQASQSGDTVYVVARARTGALALHVSDMGAGLPEPARRALRLGRTEGDRMGLGIVRDLVRGLGGRLMATELNPGTRISLRLPYMKRSEA